MLLEAQGGVGVFRLLLMKIFVRYLFFFFLGLTLYQRTKIFIRRSRNTLHVFWAPWSFGGNTVHRVQLKLGF